LDCQLFSISLQEFESCVGYLADKQHLEYRIVFGFYLRVLSRLGVKIIILGQLSMSCLCEEC
jgi:hypothetical protein